MDDIKAPTFLPDPDRINRMVNEAINLLGAAALGAAGMLLQDELSGDPPDTVPADATTDWRNSKQRTLAELRSQVMQSDRAEGEINQTVISEAFGVFVDSIPELVQEAAETAITQAWIVASSEVEL
jgi:hypothetical protein